MGIKVVAKRVAATLLVSATLILTVKAVRRTFFPRATANNDSVVKVGQRISLPGLAWPRGSRTVILALEESCPFCHRSAPFYQKLLKRVAEQQSIRVIAVFPDSAARGREYLEAMNVPVEKVEQADFTALGVRRTPTLLVINDQGLISNLFVGMIAQRDEEWVAEAVLNEAAH